MLPRQGQVKGVHHHQALIIWNVKEIYLKEDDQKYEQEYDKKLTTINNWTEKNPNKSKLSKQLEQEQKDRNGDHMEGYQQGSGRGRGGERYRE